jgi:hypothetical protein
MEVAFNPPHGSAFRLAMRIDYDNRYFRSVRNVDGGDVDPDTLFHYRQEGDVVWATYRGGRVAVRYQQISKDGIIKTGRCLSTPEILSDGRLRLHESWSWIEGAVGAGESRIEEVGQPQAG